MRKIMILLLTAIIFSTATASQLDRETILMEATFYENGTAPSVETLESKEAPKSSSFYNAGEPYEIALSNDGEELWRKTIPVSFDVVFRSIAPDNGSSLDQAREVSKKLWLPFESRATELEVYYDSQVVKEIDLVSRFCKYDNECSSYCSGRNVDPDCTCGDDVCQGHEDAEICSVDCANSFSDEREGNSSKEDSETQDGDDGLGLVWIYPLILLFVGGFVWVVFRSDL